MCNLILFSLLSKKLHMRGPDVVLGEICVLIKSQLNMKYNVLNK